MPKLLVCASTLIHIRNFHLPYLRYFKEQGWQVHVAVPQTEPVPYTDRMHEIPMAKSILSPKNAAAVLRLRRVLKENRFDLVMTHAALAGIIARTGVLTAGSIIRNSTKVIHTSHGYFFWRDSGLFRRIMYYTPEWLLRRVTDCVVTMNSEDYAAAKKLVKKGGLAAKVPGMGADGARFIPASDTQKASARQALRIPDNASAIVYAAEFSKRKNHAELLQAFAETVARVPEALLLLCGDGRLQDTIKSQAAELGLRDHIRFLGWRSRMEEVYTACDLAVSASVSEGLPFNIIEAQLCALPVAASRIRGHIDLIADGDTGLLYQPGNSKDLSAILVRLIRNTGLRAQLGAAARKSAEQFTLEKAFTANTDVYKKVIEGR